MLNEWIAQDQHLFLYLNGLGSPPWDTFWLVVTSKYSMIPLYGALLYLIWRKERKHTWWALLGFAVVITLCDRISVECFKEVFQRLRPGHEPTIAPYTRLLQGKGGLYSFVSSHATNVFGMSTFFYLAFRKHYPQSIWLFLWAALVSYSRIYVGKHYPLDLLGGALLGASIGFLVFLLYQTFLPRSASSTRIAYRKNTKH